MIDFERIKPRVRVNKRLHSREHLLADDLARWMHEPKKFAAYLGIAQLYHEEDLRALAKRVLVKKDLPLEARGKYFFASLKELAKKPRNKKNGTNNRNRRKK